MTSEMISAAEIARVMARHPLAFRASLPVRLRRAALWSGFVLLFCWCLYDFNFSPLRVWEGLGRLGRVLSFLFPPHVRAEWREFSELLTGLG
ncbi:MAG: hypothetical protein U1D06_13705 [Paracoccaceae bacterium]|nr:hypothetical protein [Paracoccaceae bacterium]